ncbi:MAG: NADH-quinone oxidoreductase subunit NuoF [Candidatus Bipolaricaulota bacterium]|nr:NADH-quinone oxidoreductase subunit NuoF [Candidatus Bipolaricaulota bacterium]MDW8140728.1 NADH-quinone oxidoreductase subunit NuoF [Candidatus Bipolaricaulota bacterium]
MADLAKLREQALREWEALQKGEKPQMIVGAGTCGRAAGASEVLDAIRKELARSRIDALVREVGCMGLCWAEVLVEIAKPGRPRIYYKNVTPEIASQLVDDYLVQDDPRPDLALGTIGDGPVAGIPKLSELPLMTSQRRLALARCGQINPESLYEYIATEGYAGLAKALGMQPEAVIDEVKRSGLRGRGGAGFPTGVKWELCRKAPGDEKYIICNADEGDPGAFQDRAILEGDPHTVLEGMIIAGYAIGAKKGYIYVRAEYPLAVERLRCALGQAYEHGLLGKNILNSGFDFDIEIFEGAGAFVCGEETALIASIEGKRGMPRTRPPYPVQSGLWGRPTSINNVKSFANVPLIIRHGAAWYSQIGTERSKGTAIFSLTGKVNNCGLVEVPMGTTLAQIIYEIGGGVPGGKRLKAVQTGGPSGGCIPAHLMNTPVDFDSLTALGSMMGSGGMVVMDEDTCMIDIARYFLDFTQKESCGKCAPCRLGTKQMLSILERITQGQGQMEDLARLEHLAKSVKAGSLCGLGQTAPNPVLTTLRYFREEYEEHIKYKRCRAAVCKGLVKAPCSHTCPAEIDVPRYVRLIAAGRFAEAHAVIRERIPFPWVCGLVCFHPCEAKCRRALVDEAIAIRALKRAAAERDDGRWKLYVKRSFSTGKRVAIVGSGPAGLTAAYYLARKGHAVTIFEAFEKPGGMMRYGIPEYRLPHDILDAEISEIEALGVEILTGTKIESFEQLAEFDAVFLALGAHRGMKLGIPGEDEVGVLDCIDFLRRVKLGYRVELGERVAVIGGGNAAIDAARTALRLGAKTTVPASDADQEVLDASRMARRLGAKDVRIIYRRSSTEMPASPEEVREALAEGVQIEFLTAPVKMTRENGSIRLDCVRMRLGPVDASGRRRPEPIPHSEFSLSVDRVISAIGEAPEIPEGFGLRQTKWNTLVVDPDTLMTERPGVFAGGDVVTGPASVIEAIAAGRRVASSIDIYLGGDGDISERLLDPEEDAPFELEEGERPRVPIRALRTQERLGGFREVELGYTAEEAISEARRCLMCDLEER